MLNLFCRNRRPKDVGWSVNTPLLRFGSRDVITIGDSYETVLVMGGTGSGKTAGPAYGLTLAMMIAGYGGLVMTVKIDEVDRIRRLMALAGRSDDLIVFDEASDHGFGFLNYLIDQPGGSSGKTENILYLLESMAEIGDRANGLGQSQGDEMFWTHGRRELARNAIDLLTIVMKQLTPNFITEIIRDAPRNEAEANAPDWAKNSLIGQLLERAETMPLSQGDQHDLAQVRTYFTRTFPRLAEKTRSIIEASLSGILDPFSRGLLYRLYCGKTTVSPDETLGGKVIVVNQPLKRDMTIGLLAQTIWKALFQGRIEQRRAGEDRPVFLIMDEAQMLLSLRDVQVFSTARSSKLATLWITQNLPNVHVALGGAGEGNSKAESVLSLAQTKIFCQNSCPITNQWASELIGRKRIWMSNSSISHPPTNLFDIFPSEEERLNSGSSETFEYALQPTEFTSLTKGGAHGYCEAILFQGGKTWKATGRNFMKTRFKLGF